MDNAHVENTGHYSEQSYLVESKEFVKTTINS